MENKFRNELEIKLGEHKILLRPTFENIAAMESNLGSVSWLTWKYSRGARLGAGGKIEVSNEAAIKSLPSLTESAQIIYFNQAATKPEDATLKKYSLEEIWAMINDAGGASITPQVVIYLGRILAGNKAVDMDEVTEGEKKS